MRSDFNMIKQLDNQNNLLGDDLKETIEPNSKLKIAASYFSIYAYEALKKELEKIDSLEFIFTSPTFIPEDELESQFKKELREFFIPKLGRERTLYGSDFELTLRNQLTQKAIAKECADWIRKKVTFKSNRSNNSIQPFIYNRTSDESYIYTPVKGFSAADLGYQASDDISFPMRMKGAPLTEQFLIKFNQLWNDDDALESVTDIVCKYMESVYEENSPERIYFIILYNIFGQFLEEMSSDTMPNDKTGYQETLVWQKLFNYQRDAAIGIINKLESFNGCILADSVGLGKTFTALAVVKYYELRNRSVLVLCPKRLANNWLTYNKNLKTNIFHEDRFRYDVLAHTDLDRTTGEAFGMPINQINWGNYDLVVIDESHNFRNNEAVKDRETRYQKLMRKVIQEGVETKVLMLSATPVNNHFTDLRNQLALAYEGKSSNLSKKLNLGRNIETIFKQAQTAFNRWSELPAQERTTENILNLLDFDFFELLDSVTIARSRRHIQNFYDTSEIGPFPERNKPLSFRAPLTNREDKLEYNEIFETLQRLELSVYRPLKYIFPSRLGYYESLYDTEAKGGDVKFRHADREKSLVGLMTINLLKRLESSVEAFRLTLKNLAANYNQTLEKIDNYRNGTQVDVNSLINDMDVIDENEDYIPGPDSEIGGKIRLNLADMDIDTWEKELRSDLEEINILLNFMHDVTPEEDAKLQHLIAHIEDKINHPINKGNHKVLIFSAFADTTHYLYQNVAAYFHNKYGLHSAEITGGSNKPQSTLQGERARYDMQEILTLFSPISKSKADILPDETTEIDILIATDCISEGQNLQDCDYLINYDIHWNPVRIIQRFGRIDRIGSPNKVIQLVNYWPDISLDEYINLKERVESRMTIANMSATGDDNLLTAEENDIEYRKEQLKRLQEEVIELEDVNTGVSITDLGLNEFRMDLLNFREKYGDPKNIPNGLHTVIPADKRHNIEPGIFFALKNINESVNIDRKNRLHPFYLIYIANNGEILLDQFKVKEILDLIRTSCKGRSAPIEAVYKLFNEMTKDGREMRYCSDLLDQSIKSMVRINEEKDIDSLFSGGETTALLSNFKGLDDFELLAFIVVSDEEGV